MWPWRRRAPVAATRPASSAPPHVGAEIIPITTTPIADLLRDLLRRAEDGELSAVAVAFVVRGEKQLDGPIGSAWRIHPELHSSLVLGAVEILRAHIARVLIGGED